MHPINAADAIVSLAGQIAAGFALLDGPRIQAQEGHFAAAVHKHFEDQGGQGTVGRRLNKVFPAVFVQSCGRGNVRRRRQTVAHRVQHGLNARIAQGGAAEHGRDPAGDGGPA